MSLGRHHPLLPKRNLHCARHSVKAVRVVSHPVGHELTYTPDDANEGYFPECILLFKRLVRWAGGSGTGNRKGRSSPSNSPDQAIFWWRAGVQDS